MFQGSEVSEAVTRVGEAFGEEAGRQWWLVPHPDLGGAKPGDLMLLAITGALDPAKELALRKLLNDSSALRR
jgi:hypothetical protein